MRAIALVISVLAVVALAWIGAEAHYQACVAGAVAVTGDIRPVPSVQDQLGGKAAPNNAARIDAVEGCSRLPF